MVKDNFYVLHIKDAIKDIEKYTKGLSAEDFNREGVIRDAVVHKLMIIGEAAKKLSKSFTDVYPNIPWKNIAGTRDKIVHDYFDIDYVIVWAIVTDELPALSIVVNDYFSRNPDLGV